MGGGSNVSVYYINIVYAYIYILMSFVFCLFMSCTQQGLRLERVL